jgi:hypothetical protein
MPDLSEIYKILSTFGPWGLISFRYPRPENKSKRN